MLDTMTIHETLNKYFNKNIIGILNIEYSNDKIRINFISCKAAAINNLVKYITDKYIQELNDHGILNKTMLNKNNNIIALDIYVSPEAFVSLLKIYNTLY